MMKSLVLSPSKSPTTEPLWTFASEEWSGRWPFVLLRWSHWSSAERVANANKNSNRTRSISRPKDMVGFKKAQSGNHRRRNQGGWLRRSAGMDSSRRPLQELNGDGEELALPVHQVRFVFVP